LGALGKAPGSALGEDRRRRFGPCGLDPDETELEAARRRIVELLGPTPIGLDDLVRSAGLPLPIVSLVVLELELAGRLERHPGHRIALR
jgi:DNA processing protein